MEIRFLPGESSYQRMTTQELREAYVMEDLFRPDALSMIYTDADRAIVGGAVPAGKPLRLTASKKEMAAEYFHERRETGIVNVGDEGVVNVDGTKYTLAKRDMLYVGRGAREVEFLAAGKQAPAFFFISFPAHAGHQAVHIPEPKSEKTSLGNPESANQRTIKKYIHPGGVQSCQLVMGLTELESGSIWNTMPPHTHMRRMEVYLYYDLAPDDLVVHLMGKPQETRNLLLRNRQAVLSPSWSIHCGAGSKRYSFIWAMGGENQAFADMDPVPVAEML